MNRWVLWGVLVVPYMVVYFHRLAIGVLQTDLMVEFALSATAFATVGSLYFATYALLQIPAGLLADSLGPRIAISASSLIMAAGAVIFAVAGNTAGLFLGRLVVGIGVSAVFIGILKVLALRFPEGQFATMTGLTGFVGTAGGVFAQGPLYHLAGTVGWRVVFLAVGGVSLAAAAVCYRVVQDPQDQRDPASGSLPPGQERGESPYAALWSALVQIHTNRRTWPPWLVFAGVYGAFVTLTGSFGHAYLVTVHRVPPLHASRYLTLTVAALAVGGLLFAAASDRLKRRRWPMIGMTLWATGAWVLLIFGISRDGPLLVATMVSIGASSGVVLTTLPCAKEVNDPRYTGTSTAVVNVGGFFGAAAVPVIMGWLLDTRLGYHRAVVACLAAVVVGLIGALLITETRCRSIASSCPEAVDFRMF